MQLSPRGCRGLLCISFLFLFLFKGVSEILKGLMPIKKRVRSTKFQEGGESQRGIRCEWKQQTNRLTSEKAAADTLGASNPVKTGWAPFASYPHPKNWVISKFIYFASGQRHPSSTASERLRTWSFSSPLPVFKSAVRNDQPEPWWPSQDSLLRFW